MTYLVLEICANKSKLVIKKSKELRYPGREKPEDQAIGYGSGSEMW